MLCSVVAIDCVGYSEIAGKIEASLGTEGLKLFENRLRQVIYRGVEATNFIREDVLFKLTGDGAYLRFVSAATALQCAEAVQQAVRIANGKGGFADFDLRVGIATGEVQICESSGEVSGFAITRATRLEASCSPGSILVCEDTWRSLPGSSQNDFIGPQEVTGKRGELFTAYSLPALEGGSSLKPQPAEPESEPAPDIASPEIAAPPPAPADRSMPEFADEKFGGYMRSHYEAYEGHYLSARRSFENVDNLVLARVGIEWSAERQCLVFWEAQRNAQLDGKVFERSFAGEVSIPPSVGLIQMAMRRNGLFRLMSLSLLREHKDHTMIGTLSALAHATDTSFRPATSPLMLMKLGSTAEDLDVGVRPAAELPEIAAYLDEAEKLYFKVAMGRVQTHGDDKVVSMLRRRPGA